MARNFQEKTPRPAPQIKAKQLEYVLRSYGGYRENLEKVVGYADLLITTELPCVSAIYDHDSLRGSRLPLSGFKLRWEKGPSILVEAKSTMPTLGELMRQINLYRTAFFGVVVVVSPDDKFESILADQGVCFIRYNPHRESE